jgi:hypothetical protein
MHAKATTLALGAACVLTVPPLLAAGTLRVNEEGSRLRLFEKRCELRLLVVNGSGVSLTGRATAELVDVSDKVRASGEARATLGAGLQPVDIVLTPGMAALERAAQRQILFYRLRYRLELDGPPPDTPSSLAGIVAMSRLMPDVFELRLLGPERGTAGKPLHAVVLAANPVTSRPVAGVAVEATLVADTTAGQRTVKVSRRTNLRGVAVLDFVVPGGVKQSGAGEIKVVGRRAGLSAEAATELSLYDLVNLRVSTDKSLYQPGQVLHMRVLARGSDGRALAGAELKLKVEDEDNEEQFEGKLTTSRFGVASIDWPIPEHARLGTYSLSVRRGGEQEEDDYRGVGRVSVRVSRYELPRFAMRVEPNRPYYVTGQKPDVEVHAQYLFGQPVTRGHARVVLEARRRWDYRAQRWDVEERGSQEGELDGSGRFRATFDLAEDHAELATSRWARSRDIEGTAYVSDLTTGRTEERRFALRATRDPIHLYLITRHFEPSPDAEERGCRASFYVSAYYADGTPASCEVRIARQLRLPEGDERDAGELEARGEMPSEYLTTVRTDRYGVAKVLDLELPASRAEAEVTRLVFLATDSEGRRGHTTDWPAGWSASRILVETGRTIHAPGQPIEAEIRSQSVRGPVVVEVRAADRVLSTRTLTLRGGLATVVFPYVSEYRGALSVVAYPTQAVGRYYDWWDLGQHGVVYPTGPALKVALTADRAEYRPGQEAELRFAMRRDDGRPAAGVVGLVVLDKALEERAAAEREVPLDSGFLGAVRDEGGLSGVTMRDLLALDMTKPVPAGLDLLAEVALRQGSHFNIREQMSDAFDHDIGAAFRDSFRDQLAPLGSALSRSFSEERTLPESLEGVRSALKAANVAYDTWRDPWGQPYRLVVEPRYDRIWVEAVSAGPDKQQKTTDDLVGLNRSWRYFALHAAVVRRAADAYYARSDQPIRDLAVLRQELRDQGEDLDAWRDPWGQPYAYELGIAGRYAKITVKSAGPDRVFTQRRTDPSDDVVVWTVQNEYFARGKARIGAALEQGFQKAAIFPQGDEGWENALAVAGLRPDTLIDPWGRAYEPVFRTVSVYGSRIKITSYAELQDQAHKRVDAAPITRTVEDVSLWSRGPDGQKGTADDFEAASFRRIVAERESAVATPEPGESTVFESGTGAIGGTVKDAQGGVINGAGVAATSYVTGVSREVKTDPGGRYLVNGLAVGAYKVAVALSGFRSVIVTRVPVQDSSRTEVNVVLEVAAMEETVEVSASVPEIQTSAGAVASVESRGAMTQPIATPRVRKYFPETLFWQPALETDAQGRATVRVPLADAVTTWKVAAIASTEDGAVAIAERELLAFQPFFVENEPPPILTAGDAIRLPALVRNYTDKTLRADVLVEAGDGLAIAGARRAVVSVAKGDSAHAVFDLRAERATKQGRVRITATSAPEGDAMEKTVTVHPDGAEAQTGQGVLVDREAAIELIVPAHAIAGSVWSELKIAPNLATHVLESVEAVMIRPWGCAEQKISSAYPSLMALRLLAGRADPAGVSVKARRYLETGYRGLLEYQDSTGGIAYFHQREPDLALTAYALRFLNDLGSVLDVDADARDAARGYLLRKQAADGSWPVTGWWSQDMDEQRTTAVTALVARVLAGTAEPAGQASVDGKKQRALAGALERALKYLDGRVGEGDDPYFLASYALAASSARSPERVEKALARLRAVAHTEKGGVYWDEQANTPFCGWGRAGRIETTALVVKALAVAGEARDQALIDGGLLFLLRSRDRYGIWWSGQATVNVLDALTSLLGATQAGPASTTLEVLVNGQAVQTLTLPKDADITGPLTVDLSTRLVNGANRIELHRPSAGGRISAQVVGDYYVPWSQATLRSSDALRFDVRFDKREAAVGDTINVHVEAQRLGFQGYGMLLAEIGLPPGVEVDRESLERAEAGSGWGLCQHEIQPDRVVAYLWPGAGGIAFDFEIRPRLAMKAQSAASKVSDYYNPDAQVVVPPVIFDVRDR